MKGDFSRIRFEPNKHYTDVLGQQGRIAYDADANEQRFIDDYRRTVETIDVIGEYGAPMHDAGFAISVVGEDIRIGRGRYYVNGLLCENLDPLNYEDQPFLLDGTTGVQVRELLDELSNSQDNPCLRVYLEVWQRMVTALDDACLGEPALGQADTTVRLQTVWRVVAKLFNSDALERANTQTDDASTQLRQDSEPQVRLLKVDTNSTTQAATKSTAITEAEATQPKGEVRGSHAPVTISSTLDGCSCSSMYIELEPTHSGTLSAQTANNGGDCGCQPIPAAGYIGLENQLYRVEIHQSGTLDTATFKWSRENASIVVAIQSVSGNKVTVNSLGMDANLGFQEGQWVEISDDTCLFGETPNQPGALYQIQHIDQPSMTLTMATTVQSVDTTRNARMRRWDQTDTTATTDGIPLSGSWLTLENGIQVCFGKGRYVSGDAWTIPARSATGQIDWPPCGGDGNPFQSPHYARIYRAPLACIHANQNAEAESLKASHQAAGTDSPFEVDDCRRLFPSLTDLGQLINAQALHITRINWKNDDVMTLDKLVQNGLVATFDQPPSSPLSPANFIVTLETAMRAARAAKQGFVAMDAFTEQDTATTESTNDAVETAQEYVTIGQHAATAPTVIRSEVIIDSLVKLHGKTVSWTLPVKGYGFGQYVQVEAINTALLAGAVAGTPARVRVKLPGRVLYAAPEGGRTIYLDGQAFGETGRSTIEKRKRIDLQFPTGNDERASDFESWFYLYPTLSVDSVDFTYQKLYVRSSNDKVTITQTDPAATATPIVQKATISLNYPAVEAATISLSMSGDASVASVPSSVAVKAGESSVSVAVTLNSAPSSDQVETFTLSASITNALGQAVAQTASFTVNSKGS